MDNAISVTQVNNYIKNIFDAELMLQNIFVYGEIGAYKITNGIAYFNLKDENSLISCVLFGANNFPMFDVGDQVVVRGSVSYYAKGGKLNLNAVSIERFGIGLLYQKFLELKQELENLGYFDPSHKKPLPARVKRIGVVTSETGAVIRDIIDVTTRRNNSVDIVLYPVKVQGLGAEKEIASGIDFFSNYDKVDVVIVARGGGSLEDLQPYNTRIVADATYRCNKPIVSAVGHETDFTIIDFVSDLRAPTPSAAAELVVNLKNDDVDRLVAYLEEISDKVTKKCNNKIQELNFANMMIAKSFDAKLNSKRNILTKSLNLLEKTMLEKINMYAEDLHKTKLQLSTYDTKTILNNGYVRVYNNGKIVKSAKNVHISDPLDLMFGDGCVSATVSNIRR